MKRNFTWLLNMLDYQCFRVNDKFNIVAILMMFACAVSNTISFEFGVHHRIMMDYKTSLFFFLLPAFVLGMVVCTGKRAKLYRAEFKTMQPEELSKWGWITFWVSFGVTLFLFFTFMRG